MAFCVQCGTALSAGARGTLTTPAAKLVLVLWFCLFPILAWANNPTFLDRAPQYDVGGSSVSVAAADMNGDGNLDLVTANHTGTVSVLLGMGDGTFPSNAQFPTPNLDDFVAVADLNGDGHPDVVTGNTYSNSMSVLLGNGDGTLQPATTYATGYTRGVAIADFNGDGAPDIAVPDGGSSTVRLFSNDGAGKFPHYQDFATAPSPSAVGAADVSRDGNVDLVVTNRYYGYSNDSVSVLLGNGDGTFQPYKDFPTSYIPSALVIADVNGDGLLDVVTANGNIAGGRDTVSVLLGNGDGTFQQHLEYAAPEPYSLAVADLNHDGKFDLVTSDIYQEGVAVLYGNGNGTFQAYRTYESGGASASVATGDLDGDGLADIVTTNLYTVGILLADGKGGFLTRPDYVVGSAPIALAQADFNHDNNPDVATADHESQSVTVLLGRRDGTFQAGTSYPLPGQPNAIIADDFNNEGFQDLVVSYDPFSHCDISILLNNGDGTFQPQQSLSAGCINAIASGDFNHDGKRDLAASGSGFVSLFLGNGNGTFQPAAQFSTGLYEGPIAVTDLNNDGNADVVVLYAGYSSGTIDVLLGNGDGTLQGPLGFRAPRQSSALAVGDLNNDGKVDVVVGSYAILLNGAHVYLGNGDGTLQDPISHEVAPYLYTLLLTDITADGKLDVLFSDFYSGPSTLGVLVGNGDGTFTNEFTFLDSGPGQITVGDFNRDGAPDVAVSSGYISNTVSVLLNQQGTRVRTTSKPNPSHQGQAVTFTVSVTASVAGALKPTGKVKLTDGKTTLAILKLRGGKAQFTTSALNAGTHQIGTSYSGDANFRPRIGPVLMQVVKP